MHSTLSPLTLVLFLGFPVLILLGAAIGLSGPERSYEYSRASELAVLRKSRATRVGRVLIGCAFFSFDAGLFSVVLYDASLHMPIWFAAFHACIEVPVGVAFVIWGQPDELRFRLTDRMVERTVGLFMFSKTESKPMTLLYGVFVGASRGDNKGYFVGISGAALRPSFIFLARYTTRGAAEDYASMLQGALGLPPTVPPSRLAPLPPIGLQPAKLALSVRQRK